MFIVYLLHPLSTVSLALYLATFALALCCLHCVLRYCTAEAITCDWLILNWSIRRRTGTKHICVTHAHTHNDSRVFHRINSRTELVVLISATARACVKRFDVWLTAKYLWSRFFIIIFMELSRPVLCPAVDLEVPGSAIKLWCVFEPPGRLTLCKWLPGITYWGNNGPHCLSCLSHGLSRQPTLPDY